MGHPVTITIVGEMRRCGTVRSHVALCCCAGCIREKDLHMVRSRFLQELRKNVAMHKGKWEADFVVSLRAREADDLGEFERSHCLWSGWKKHHWPADVIFPGIRLYGFDIKSRRICVLVEVCAGAAFPYTSKREYLKRVKDIIGMTPDTRDLHWNRLPFANGHNTFTGIALRWKVIKRVDIPLQVHFPQLGWLRLPGSTYSRIGIDPYESYVEGDQRLKTHIWLERSTKGRKRAKEYWRRKLGHLHCVACGFSFEQMYGVIGIDFIEMHHDRPLSSGRRMTAVTELRPLCSNCHRMVHRQPSEVLPIRKLKQWLKHSR